MHLNTWFSHAFVEIVELLAQLQLRTRSRAMHQDPESGNAPTGRQMGKGTPCRETHFPETFKMGCILISLSKMEALCFILLQGTVLWDFQVSWMVVAVGLGSCGKNQSAFLYVSGLTNPLQWHNQNILREKRSSSYPKHINKSSNFQTYLEFLAKIPSPLGKFASLYALLCAFLLSGKGG